MRLIHTPSFNLVEFNKDLPPYAILSHTWRDEEATIEDFNAFTTRLPRRRNIIDYAKGFEICRGKYQRFDKILGACDLAQKQGLKYIWIDTCCIDKSKSAELDESTNSMFLWYQRSHICYAYLEDFKLTGGVLNREAFGRCRWFKRAWTLQELLAPTFVVFYDQSWNPLGEKTSLGSILSDITGIETSFLTKTTSIHTASVAKRMSWAAAREATREEDRAYSLLGIFGVNMSLIYGERSKAFIRLQEEILKEIDDHSIFAWMKDRKKRQDFLVTNCGEPGCRDPQCDASVCANPRCRNSTCAITIADQSHSGDSDSDEPHTGRVGRQIRGIFATSPSDFARSGDITSFAQAKAKEGHITITNRGIYMPSMLSSIAIKGKNVPVLVLNCFNNQPDPIALFLHHETGDQYTRAWPTQLTNCASEGCGVIYALKSLSTFRIVPGAPLDNSIILNVFEVSPSTTLSGALPGLVTREGKKLFPTGSRVPYQTSLLLDSPNGTVKVWFGTKLQGGGSSTLV
ncbi:HET-domain-containing protein [Xylaria grammica]|nr:HET-domain-containing protein [Xylaria grammica]